MAKNPVFGHFWPKWPFLAIFGENSPVATGPKTAKMAKNGHFPQKAGKVGVPGGGFTSTPRAGAPRFPGAGEKGGFPGPGRGVAFGASQEVPEGPGGPRSPDRPRGTAGGRREGLM